MNHDEIFAYIILFCFTFIVFNVYGLVYFIVGSIVLFYLMEYRKV